MSPKRRKKALAEVSINRYKRPLPRNSAETSGQGVLERKRLGDHESGLFVNFSPDGGRAILYAGGDMDMHAVRIWLDI